MKISIRCREWNHSESESAESSLLKNIETVKKNKRTNTGGVLPPSVLNHIGKFTETLHKIHTFVESQQSGSKVKQFLRQGEMNTLLKDCKNGLTQGLDFFQLKNTVHKFCWSIYDEQDLFSIPKQLSINLNAAIRPQDISWS
ncbi:hypothetical protein MVEN_00720500 [Mycena venus]|uniref:Uncharacterized protein n=1 Tax=Mycena venus TaxID=2733690 RepID=A0A8H6YF01_9AGAR|nr:hypothetical protein MVEN_00720500 [Mycena venus]